MDIPLWRGWRWRCLPAELVSLIVGSHVNVMSSKLRRRCQVTPPFLMMWLLIVLFGCPLCIFDFIGDSGHFCVCVYVCESLQSCLTLWDSMDSSRPGSSVRGDSPAKNTAVGYHAYLQVCLWHNHKHIWLLT